jgi:parvulin-like peptidyl-prolyl isomerase
MNYPSPVETAFFDPLTLEQLQNETIATCDLLALLRRYQLMPKLLREMVIDQAIAPFPHTPEEVAESYRAFYTQQKLQSEQELQNWLIRNKFDKLQLDLLIVRGIKLEKFKQINWKNQLQSYFLKRKRFLDRVIYSLIRVRESAIARELFFRLQEGEESFAEVAKAYSLGHEAQTAGLIGPVELSRPHPALAQLLATHEPGQIIPPIHLDGWVVIVRVEQFFPATLDQEMRQRLLHELFEQWLEKQLAETYDVPWDDASSLSRGDSTL